MDYEAMWREAYQKISERADQIKADAQASELALRKADGLREALRIMDGVVLYHPAI